MKKVILFSVITAVLCLSPINIKPFKAGCSPFMNEVEASYTDEIYNNFTYKYKKESSYGGLKYRVYNDEAAIVKYTSSWEDVIVPETVDGYKVVAILEDTFKECKNIVNVELPNTIVYIGQNAFCNCSNLEKINLPVNIERIQQATFYGCTNLKEIELPQNITYIGINAFRDCTSLEKIIIPDGVITMERDIFNGCTNLKSIYIPDSVETMGEYMFYNCYNLEYVKLPENIKTVEPYFFSYCSNLKNIILPAEIEKIYQGVFLQCTNLNFVVFKGNAPTFGNSCFSSNADDFKIYYLVENSGWSDIQDYNCVPIPVGDINIDGNINEADTAFLMKKITNPNYTTPIEDITDNKKYLDIKPDNEINILDAIALLNTLES